MRRFIQDKGRTSKPQVWEVKVDKKSTIITWGQLGGKMQRTVQYFDAPLNKGKKNEKSAQVQAAEYADREITKRVRRGYREVDLKTGEYLEQASSNKIRFDLLPENLRFYKPQNSLSGHCKKLVDKHEAWLTRKRDGMMHTISINGKGHPTIYSSTMQTHHKDEPDTPFLARYPQLQKELQRLSLPPKTVLLGELVTCVAGGYLDEMGMAVDDFHYVESITKSLTPLSLEKQEEGGFVGYCVWDIAFWAGKCWLTESRTKDRFDALWNLMRGGEYITVPEIIRLQDDWFLVESVEAEDKWELDYDYDDVSTDMLELAKEWGWEGYVVVDPSVPYGEKSYTFNGKADRPKFVSKLKPVYEADFIVMWDPDNGIGKWGKGKKANGVGSAMAYLWDPEKKEEVEVSLVGGGLTDEDVARLANPELYPMVWQVEFDSMTPKGALRFAEFVRTRNDKSVRECTFDQIPERFLNQLETRKEK